MSPPTDDENAPHMDEPAPQHVAAPEYDTGTAVTAARTVTFLFTEGRAVSTDAAVGLARSG